jgi:hydroxymethylpyrimidine/phosphomethylpyrimidine kinase
MKSSSGFRLLAEDAIPSLRKLCAIATLSTPNTAEAEALSGIRIKTKEDKKGAARKIGDCVITGGDADAKDLLHFNGEFTDFPGVKKNVKVHGTGCMFASALAVYLAHGLEAPEAVSKAKEYVTEKIEGSIRLGGGFRLAAQTRKTAEERIVRELESAIRKFASDKDAVKAAPEVGINIAYALPNARTVNDVYGLTGRIIKAGDRLVPVGEVKRGGSNHVARVVLTAMKHDPTKRAAMNIKYSPENVEAAKKLGLTTSSFDRTKQHSDTPTMEWGTEEAIKKRGRIPDVIYDKGSVGKEAMIRITGKTPTEVVGKALKIANLS